MGGALLRSPRPYFSLLLRGGDGSCLAEGHGPADERLELQRRVAEAQDFYQVLGTDTEASLDDIKRAYRALVLLLHPDKNRLPGAEEAFKIVSQAFLTLSSPAQRKAYDEAAQQPARCTSEEEAAAASPPAMRVYVDTGMDADEVFRTFFGASTLAPAGLASRAGEISGSTGSGCSDTGRDAQASTWPSAAEEMAGGGSLLRGRIQLLLQVATALLVLSLALLASRSPKTPWRLQQEDGYNAQLSSQRFIVPFFVQDAAVFDKDYPPQSSERARLEDQVRQRSRRCSTPASAPRRGRPSATAQMQTALALASTDSPPPYPLRALSLPLDLPQPVLELARASSAQSIAAM